MPADIIRHFERLAIARDRAALALTVHPHKATMDKLGYDESLGQIRSLAKRKSRFFKRFNYQWAKERSSYSNPMEAYLQWRLLEALSDVDDDHPNYVMFGDICVRLFGSADMNVECIRDENYKYVAISTAFIKYVWEYIHCFDIVLPRERYEDRFAFTFNFIPTWCEADLIRAENEEIPAIDQLIKLSMEYSNYKIPKNKPKYEHALPLDDMRLFFISCLTHSVDTFVVLHEVGHFLSHTEDAGRRSISDELEADEIGLSLSIVLAAQSMAFAPVVAIGPACTFAMLKHFSLCRGAFSIGSPEADANDDVLGDWAGEYREIAIREGTFAESMLRAGLPPAYVDLYRNLCREFEFLLEITKARLRTYARAIEDLRSEGLLPPRA